MVYYMTALKKNKNSIPSQKPMENNNLTLRNYENTGSGFFNNIVQGFALGTGSQLAVRTIDTIFGNRKIEIDNNKCVKESELYLKCLENNDKNSCINFFYELENCKKS